MPAEETEENLESKLQPYRLDCKDALECSSSLGVENLGWPVLTVSRRKLQREMLGNFLQVAWIVPCNRGWGEQRDLPCCSVNSFDSQVYMLDWFSHFSFTVMANCVVRLGLGSGEGLPINPVAVIEIQFIY